MIEKQLKKWFSSRLLNWHRDQNRRSMPWKGIKDPYKIWLSEVILQQTRVEQGLSYYERFVAAFPDVHALAAAEEARVFKLWEGLGYYSRCRNLIITARHISHNLGGEFPDTLEGLLSLKGVGTYTAAAIGSFAFGLPLAVVDGNVMRVLTRVTGIDDPIDQPAVKKKLTTLASLLLDNQAPALYNQAIMDLGATVCKPRQPNCLDCPFSPKCKALATGRQDQLPVKSKKIRQRERFFYYLLAEQGDALLVRQRKGKDIWQDLFELVLAEKDEPLPDEAMKDLNTWNVGNERFIILEISPVFQHQLTHQRIQARFVRIRLEKRVSLKGYEWVKRSSITNLAFPILIARYLDRHFV